MVKQYNIIPHGNITNNNGVLSGFTTNTYASLNKIFNPVNNSYEVVFKVNSNNISDEQIIFQCGDIMSSSGYIDLEIYNSKLYFELAKNGGQTFYFEGSTTLVSQTDYWAKLTFDGTYRYELSLSTDGVNYSIENSVINFNILGDSINNQPYIGIDRELTRWYFNGTIDLNESYIKINDNIWWQGVSDVTRIQLRHDTANNWSAINPILLEGEVGLELDTGKQKVGDGVTAWNNLDYNYYTETETDDLLADKQNILVSGTNIKTINNTSLLGSGNIDTSDVFIAEYNVTSFSDIQAAYNAGKAVFCNYSTMLIPLSAINSSAVFFAVTNYNGNSNELASRSYRCTNSNVWSIYLTYTVNPERTSNKVTSLSSSSTDTQYPSAKCVYDLTENNRFDGQWVNSITTLSTAKAINTYTLSLVSYLPADNYNYLVHVQVKGYLNASGKSSQQYLSSDIYHMPDTINEPSGSYTRTFINNLYIPVGAGRELTYQITRNALTDGHVIAYGYKRLGTNV